MEHATTTVESMIGAMVKVREDCRCPMELRGLMGTVLAGYGKPVHVAYEVLLENGISGLFWQHELLDVEEWRFG